MPSTMLLRSRAHAVVALVVAIMLTVAAAVEPAWLRSTDAALSEWIRGWGTHGFFRAVTHMGSINGAIVISIAAAVLLWMRCRPMALAFPGVVLIAIVLDVSLKVIVGRERPIGALVGTNLGSFPSGHVIMAVTLLGLAVPALWIITRSRTIFWSTIVLLAAGVTLVSLSRVNLGAHWPSDVVASALIGAAVLLLAEYLLATEWACERCGGCALHPPS